MSSMRSIGVVRKVDNLGRVVIPKETRDINDWPEGTPLEIFTDGDTVILKKYEPGCVFCGNVNDVTQVNGKNVCQKCKIELKRGD